MAAPVDLLAPYWAKRDFAKTPEPRGVQDADGHEQTFVVQKHAATRLHYDLRLALGGVLLSWAVPKGPSLDPADKRMAIRTEDHPLAYASFEGTIPPKQYGAGTLIVWDRGVWTPVGDARAGLDKGKLVFELQGHKLAGRWELVRIKKPDDRHEPWILFKKRDRQARPKSEYDVLTALPDSVIARPLPGPLAPHRPAVADDTSPGTGAAAAVAPAPAVAVEAELPRILLPQLATLVTSLPATGTWAFEIKLDGYRLLARVQSGAPTLITRGGKDWSAKMPRLVEDIESLGLKRTWLDGEIVAFDKDGVPRFNALQDAINRNGAEGVVYFVFDLPYFEGYDLRQVPLKERRQLLRRLLEAQTSERIRFSEDFQADVANLLQSARQMNIEGVIAKRTDSAYESGRSQTWLKLKCKQRQEFVVGGYTERANAAGEVGGLLLGVYDAAGRLVFVGSVGTGWSAATAAELKSHLRGLERPHSPFDAASVPPRSRWATRAVGSERWVRPVTVADVEFAEWTTAGQLRQASFIGLRTDKPPEAISRERAVDPSELDLKPAPPAPVRVAPMRAAARAGTVLGFKVSHPERVIDPTTGVTKLDLVRYYESMAEAMLPHLVGRPCSLVRGPDGTSGELFFQKHLEHLKVLGLRELDTALMPGHAPLLEVPDARTLVGAAQMNVIELHTWNALAASIDTPDRIVFDLDPGEGLAWSRFREAAVLTRAMLTELGLASWLKTSGGKGLHVVVPVAPQHGWEVVKGFSQAVAKHLARVIPDRFTATSGAAKRIGKVYVDYLRNSRGGTTVAAFSARARPGLGVSMPLSWEQLDSLQSASQWSVATARDHLSFRTADPWEDYWRSTQSITGAMEVLGCSPRAVP